MWDEAEVVEHIGTVEAFSGVRLSSAVVGFCRPPLFTGAPAQGEGIRRAAPRIPR